MFDQTDVEKVKYLLSKGIDYERAKKLVTEQKAISASTNLAWDTANQIINNPQQAPTPVVPQQAPATPRYDINPTPAQAKPLYPIPLQAPNALQKMDSTWAQFDNTKVGKAIEWFKEGIGAWVEGVKTAYQWGKWLVKKAIWMETDTSVSEDLLNLAEWATTAWLTAIYPIGAGLFWSASKVWWAPSRAVENIWQFNQQLWWLITKIPWARQYRDSLAPEDQIRFDNLAWTRAILWVSKATSEFNKYREAKRVQSYQPTAGRSPTSYVDENGNIVDYGPPPWSKALNAPEPVAKPPSYGPREPEVNKLLTKAVAQNVGWLKDAPKVKKSLDNLKGWITTIVQLKNSIQSLPKDEAGNIDYKAIDQSDQSAQTIVSQSISEAKQQLRTEVETAIQTAWTEQIRPDPTPLITMLNDQTKSFIDSQWQIIPGTESAYREYQNIINYLVDWQKTVSDLQKLSTQLNRDAKQLYLGNPTPTSVIAEAVNYHLRQLLDDTIENQLWVLWFGELKRKRGELKSIEPAITKRWQVIDRQKPTWLFDFLGNFWITAEIVQWVIGIATWWGVANIATSLAKATGIKLLMNYIKDRNSQSKMLIKAMKILDEANEGREHSFNMNTPQFQAKKAQRSAEQARQEAEAKRKRAETYLQAQRYRQPQALTNNPQWLVFGSNKANIGSNKPQPKGKIIVRETGMIWVQRKPKEVFQVKSDIQKTEQKPKDNSMERLMELDTDPNYEKVRPDEILYPKREQYETQYWKIDNVAFDRSTQKIIIDWKSYSRWDVTIYRRLSEKEIKDSQTINNYNELRQKLQDIKSGKENKISWPQLAWIMEDLGIEKIADIPDESLQTVLDMARARVNKPSGILWVKKEEPKAQPEQTTSIEPQTAETNYPKARTYLEEAGLPAFAIEKNIKRIDNIIWNAPIKDKLEAIRVLLNWLNENSKDALALELWVKIPNWLEKWTDFILWVVGNNSKILEVKGKIKILKDSLAETYTSFINDGRKKLAEKNIDMTITNNRNEYINTFTNIVSGKMKEKWIDWEVMYYAMYPQYIQEQLRSPDKSLAKKESPSIINQNLSIKKSENDTQTNKVWSEQPARPSQGILWRTTEQRQGGSTAMTKSPEVVWWQPIVKDEPASTQWGSPLLQQTKVSWWVGWWWKSIEATTDTGLLEEARKYETAEDFIASKKLLYHWSPNPNIRFSDWSIDFTNDISLANSFANATDRGWLQKGEVPTIYKALLDLGNNVRMISTESEYEQYYDVSNEKWKELMKQWYTSLVYTPSGWWPIYYKVFRAYQVTTESQLKQIREQANAMPQQKQWLLGKNTIAQKTNAVPAVEQILESKWFSTKRSDYTTEELAILENYWGKGSVAGWGRAILNQFFTPKEMVDAMRKLALNYARKTDTILEPAVWTWRFLEWAPNGSSVDAYEIDKVPATIAKILHPDANVKVQDFTDLFMDGRYPKRVYDWKKYDIVIGNPPYEAREHKNKWLWLEVWVRRFEDFFIKKWVEMLNDWGVLVYVVPQGTAQRIIESKRWSVRRILNLPRGIFPDTQVNTQILVIQKYSQDLWTPIPEDMWARTSWIDRFGKPMEYIKSDNPIGELQKISIDKRDISKTTEATINEFNFGFGAEPVETKVEMKWSTHTNVRTNKKGNQSILVSPYSPELIDITSGNTDPRLLEYQTMTNTLWMLEEWWDIIRWDYAIEMAEWDIDNLNYYNGNVYPNQTYLKGNLYDKLDTLERERDSINNKLYEKQKDLIESVLPKPISISDVRFSVNDKKIMSIKSSKPVDGYNWETYIPDIKELFFDWLSDNKIRWRYADTRDIKTYIRWWKIDKELKLKIEWEADEAFNRFMSEGLDPEMKSIIEQQYNRLLRSTYIPDYLTFPLSIKWISKTFNWKLLEIRPNQIEAVNFINYKWSWILAHWVWHGKTMEAVLVVENALQQWKAKRPIIVVPASILGDSKGRKDTIQQLLPHRDIVYFWGLWVKDIERLVTDLWSDYTQWIKDGQIGMISYEWLWNLSFSPDVEQSLLSSLRDAVGKETETAKQMESQNAKLDTALWQWLRGKELYFDKMGIDHITVDEAHNFKNLFSNAVWEVDKEGKPERWNRYGDLQWSTSLRAKKLYLATQYTMKQNNNTNVVLLTATPFNNSPMEVYNMLSYVARARLDDMGILNMNDFFPKFANFQEERVVKADNSVMMSRTMKNWKNKPELQSLLFEHLNFKPDNEDLVKPENKLIDMKIQMSSLQEEIQKSIISDYMQSKEPWQLLVWIGEARMNALSPYFTRSYERSWKPAPTPMEVVQNSPKIALFGDIIKRVVKDWLRDWAVFYSELWEKYFDAIAQWLSEYTGIPRSKIGIFWWSIPQAKRSTIIDKYNNGEYQVLIASKVVKEWINLQQNWYIFYDTQIDWNPTGQTQKMGRQWRYGNKRNFVITWLPLLENSLDSFMLQKWQEKQDRISDIFSIDDQREWEIQGIDPEEQKYALITDIEKKTKLRADIEISKVDDTIRTIKNQMDEYVNIKKAIEKETTQTSYLLDQVKEYQNKVDNDPSNTYRGRALTNAKKEYTNANNRLKTKEKTLTSKWILEQDQWKERWDNKERELKIANEEKLSIEEKIPDKRLQFEQEKIEMERSRRTSEDYVNDIAELNQKLEYHDVESQRELMRSNYSKEYPEKRVMKGILGNNSQDINR